MNNDHNTNNNNKEEEDHTLRYYTLRRQKTTTMKQQQETTAIMTLRLVSLVAAAAKIVAVVAIMLTTKAATTMAGASSSRSHSQHHLRADFVKAMDQAMAGVASSSNNQELLLKQRVERHELFLERLREVAKPLGFELKNGDEEQQEQPGEKEKEAFIPGFKEEGSKEEEESVVVDTVDLHDYYYDYAHNGNRNLEEWQGYGVNLTEYALKYVGCSNIKTWSDELANEGQNNGGGYDSVLKTERFVVLRLCPRDECSNYNKYGCLEGYGDYVVPMEVYLQIMAETFFAQYQEYCYTCSQCMSAVNGNNNGNYNNNNNNANNGNYNNDDAAANNNNRNRRHLQNDDAYNMNDDAANNNMNDDAANANYNNNNNNAYGDDAVNNGNNNGNNADDDYYNYYQNNANNMNNGGCEYYAVCENYESACQDYNYVASDLEQYFGCGEFYVGNSLGYLGPHCKSDGKTIALGIFHDENCYEYNADLNEMSNYMTVSDNDLEAYYSKNCISCLASDGYTLEVDNNGDGYSDVSDICGALYDESAKCNKYMGNLGDYASANQEGTEDMVCGFIHNLVTNSYDEYGEIYLKGESWTEYLPHMEEMSKWQKYLLSSMVLGCVCLSFVAGYLHRKITQRRLVWLPRTKKGYSSNDPGHSYQLNERGNSGIIQGRSQSSNFEMKDGGVMS